MSQDEDTERYRLSVYTDAYSDEPFMGFRRKRVAHGEPDAMSELWRWMPIDCYQAIMRAAELARQ